MRGRLSRNASVTLCLSGLFAAGVVGAAADAEAQATCVDSTGDMCLQVVRSGRPDGVVEDIFRTSNGLFAPQLHFASYIRGVNGCIGQTHTPTELSGYTCGAAGSNPPGGNDPAFHANSLDWFWTQVNRTRDDGSAVADGEAGFYIPWRGRIYDLGGEANRVALFPITDHPPLPCEAFEYSVWLSNNPDATELAAEGVPDSTKWNPARLTQAFTQGWTRNPQATGVAEASRADLDAHLHNLANGDAVADALTTVWALPCGLTFRYVAIQGGNYGNPSSVCTFHSSEDELDAVAGLNEDDTAICLDEDGDGHRAMSCGGGDCDDTNPAIHPGAFEACDATSDFNCVPNSPCADGTICDVASGLCLPACFEGGCAEGDTCTSSGFCVEDACAARETPCERGTVCHLGNCVGPCENVECPIGQQCVGGACIDPCQGVVCPSTQICIADQPGATTLCGPGCTCSEATITCPTGDVCDTRTGSETVGECVDSGCENVTCPAGEFCANGTCRSRCDLGIDHVACPRGQACVAGNCVVDRCANVLCDSTTVCRDGSCVDRCMGVSCPVGQICTNGTCAADPCASVMCGANQRCVGGVCQATSSDAGQFDGSFDGSARRDAGTTRRSEDGGCGCRAVGRSGSRTELAWAGLVLAWVVARRRRR